MTIRVVPGRDLDQADSRAWAAIQAGSAAFANPFFSPEFTRAVAFARDDVRVAILDDEDRQPAGFFPFHDNGNGIAEPIGGRINDYQAVIVREKAVWSAEQLFSHCGIRHLTFRHLLAFQSEFRPWHEAPSRSILINLSLGFDAWAGCIRARGSRIIAKIERLARQLEQDLGPLAFQPQSLCAAELEGLMACKSNQYTRSGRVDRFGISWIREVLQAVHATRDAGFSGMLSTLKAGSETIAAHFGMRSGTVWHYWFPCYDRRFAAWSPGLILLLRMARVAPELGIHTIDLGAGEADYKSRLMNDAVALAEGVVEFPCGF
jgi:CelD/BcsL family acetyltransferase involved in cellulose biosynthesis